MPKQLTFPRVMTAMKRCANGEWERLRFGQYETIVIVKENGWPVDRAREPVTANYPVTEVELADGTVLLLDEPFYNIEKHYYG